MVKDVTWKHVSIILGFFATVAVLAVSGQDTAAFIVVGMAVLAGIGLVAVQAGAAKEQTAAVKEQTNGNTTRLLDIVEAQGKLLASMQPPPTDDQEVQR